MEERKGKTKKVNKRKNNTKKKCSIHILQTKNESLKKEEGSCLKKIGPNSAFFSSALGESDDERTKAR